MVLILNINYLLVKKSDIMHKIRRKLSSIEKKSEISVILLLFFLCVLCIV